MLGLRFWLSFYKEWVWWLRCYKGLILLIKLLVGVDDFDMMGVLNPTECDFYFLEDINCGCVEKKLLIVNYWIRSNIS